VNMKKLLSVFLSISFLLIMPLMVKAEEITGKVEQTREISINSGLTIPIVFAYPVNSLSIRKGDVLPIKINQDIMVNNTLLFKKGNEGIVFIEEAKPARAWGRAGLIEINSGKINDIYGNEYPITLTNHSKGNTSKAAIILPIVSIIFLWPLLFFAFKKGEEVSIPPGKIFNAFITSPTTIKISQ